MKLGICSPYMSYVSIPKAKTQPPGTPMAGFWGITSLFFVERQDCVINMKGLGEQANQRGYGHHQYKQVADGHADPQTGGSLPTLVHVLAPDQKGDEETGNGGGNGGSKVGDEDQLGGGTAITVADNSAEGQADQTANPNKLGGEANILVKPSSQQNHAALGIAQQRGEACTQQRDTHDVPGSVAHNGHQ